EAEGRHPVELNFVAVFGRQDAEKVGLLVHARGPGRKNPFAPRLNRKERLFEMIARPAVIRDEGAVMARDHADPPRSADASAGEIVARPCIAIDQLPLVWAPGIERLFARLAGAIAGCLERK